MIADRQTTYAAWPRLARTSAALAATWLFVSGLVVRAPPTRRQMDASDHVVIFLVGTCMAISA